MGTMEARAVVERNWYGARQACCAMGGETETALRTPTLQRGFRASAETLPAVDERKTTTCCGS